MRNAAIVQARMGSSRLSGKIMRMVNGRPILNYIFDKIDFKIEEVIDLLIEIRN